MHDMTRARFVAAIALLGLLVASVIWIAGYLWASHQCIEGGRGTDLLGSTEGTVEVVDGRCRATDIHGIVREVPLSEWQWNQVALLIAAGSVGGLVLGVTSELRSRRRPDSR